MKLAGKIDGSKVYLLGAVGAIFYFLRYTGLVDVSIEQEENIMKGLGFLLAMAARSTLKKIETK